MKAKIDWSDKKARAEYAKKKWREKHPPKNKKEQRPKDEVKTPSKKDAPPSNKSYNITEKNENKIQKSNNVITGKTSLKCGDFEVCIEDTRKMEDRSKEALKLLHIISEALGDDEETEEVEEEEEEEEASIIPTQKEIKEYHGEIKRKKGRPPKADVEPLSDEEAKLAKNLFKDTPTEKEDDDDEDDDEVDENE